MYLSRDSSIQRLSDRNKNSFLELPNRQYANSQVRMATNNEMSTQEIMAFKEKQRRIMFSPVVHTKSSLAKIVGAENKYPTARHSQDHLKSLTRIESIKKIYEEDDEKAIYPKTQKKFSLPKSNSNESIFKDEDKPDEMIEYNIENGPASRKASQPFSRHASQPEIEEASPR